MLNDMTRDDVQIVEFPYPDDWYDKPEMLTPEMENPTELRLKRDHKHDLAFRPLETALEKGDDRCDVHARAVPCRSCRRRRASSSRSRTCPGIRTGHCRGPTFPPTITVHRRACKEHPELVVALLKGLIKVGRWANEHKRAAARSSTSRPTTCDVEDTYEGIKPVDMVPNLSPQNLVSVEIGKDFMLSHSYIKNDFDVFEWAAPEFLEKAAKELLEQQWKKTTMAKLPEATELPVSGQRIG